MSSSCRLAIAYARPRGCPSRADPPAVLCRARSPGNLDKILLQLEAPVRVGVVLLVQPLDALAEADHLRFGQEVLWVPPSPPSFSSSCTFRSTARSRSSASCCACRSFNAARSGDIRGDVLQAEHSGELSGNILGAFSEHSCREVRGRFARKVRGCRIYQQTRRLI